MNRIVKQVAIGCCLLTMLNGCKKDNCAQKNKDTVYELDPTSFSKIPYKDNDTIVLKLESTGDTVSFIAGKWVLANEVADEDPCGNTITIQSRSLTFTCRQHQYENFIGKDIIIKQWMSRISNQEELSIWFGGKNYRFPMSKIGNNYQVDSVVIKGETYHDVHFITDQEASPFPFGCFYHVKYGILKIHFMDKSWPVPEGGRP